MLFLPKNNLIVTFIAQLNANEQVCNCTGTPEVKVVSKTIQNLSFSSSEIVDVFEIYV